MKDKVERAARSRGGTEAWGHGSDEQLVQLFGYERLVDQVAGWKSYAQLIPKRSMAFRTKAKIPAPSKTVTGRVKTQAINKFRRVAFCKPDLFAAIAPATPDDRTCVVLTGNPYLSAARIVHAATNSAAAPCP